MDGFIKDGQSSFSRTNGCDHSALGGRLMLVLLLAALLVLAACDGGGGGASSDVTPPSPGGSGSLTLAFDGSTRLTISWSEASDAITAPASLEYLLYYSGSDNLGTVADVESNGTPVGTLAAAVTTATVTGLTPKTCPYRKPRPY